MIYTGGYGADMATYIDGGTVRLKGTSTNNGIVGVSRWLYVNNDASLDVDLSAGENNIGMIGISTFYHQTSGVVSVSVDTLNSYSYLIYSLYQQGAGDINLTSEGKAKVISYEFYQYSGGTGTVTVKGYLNDFRPVKKTCTVEGYDNVIWSYYTTNPLGTVNGHFLCDSTGAPIKDPVIKYVESQPLTVTDSPIYDIPETKVGESFKKANIYWYLGCKGGIGDYKFYLADDSDPLPEGVSVNSGGSFDGAPTDAHAPGEAKIKVVSGEETAYFTINYGEIKERDYFLTIDGTAVNMASDSTGTGYSYTAENQTLTLSGYKGGPVISEKPLTIVLDGANTITMAPDSEYGIKVDGKLTIDDTTSPADDSLDIICNEPDAYATMIYTGGYGADMATYIDGGTVRLKGTSTNNGIVGVSRWLYVNNDASLDVDLSAGENNIGMIGISTFYHQTSGVVSVSVDTLNSYSYLIYSLYQQGAGDINLTSEGKAKVISYEFYQYSGGTGTVTVKGYLNDFRPVKKTCTVEGYDNVIWSYYTTNPLGTVNGHFLCDSTGAPIKDPVIKYVESQPLTVTDSPIYDIPETKVGESFKKANIYWYLGCKGGIGDYKFYLADDSDPLPEGVSVNSGGSFDGAPTDAHAAGEVKIKVVSGTETAYFTVNYGEITYNNPVTSMELDKTEAALNKGESVDLTATIYPSDADKRNVNWSLSSNLGILEELSYDENSNTRMARFTAGDTAGTLDITASALIGGFKKKCTVYIKESKPTASAGNKYIEGLEAGKAYTVNGTAYTADSSGKIEIDDSWRETTVSIVRTNEELKCNSDAQELTVGKYTAGDINTFTDDVSVEYSSVTYDGNKKEPQVTITGLVLDTDYTVSYENNENAGKATVVITGKGDYCGTMYRYFTIDKASIEEFEFTLSDTEYTYDKTEKKPEISVSGLVKDTDYTVAYKNNTAAGTATVTITGKGNYQGTITKSFTIKTVSIEDKEVNISATEFVYDGTAKTPVISILGLIKDVDYKVEYSDNIFAGTAKAVIMGIGNYTGTVEKTFTITALPLDGKEASLSASEYVYDGTQKKPVVTIEGLTEGVDFEVTYSDNIAAGTAKTVIKGIGGYTGTIEKTFVIKKATLSGITAKGYSGVYNRAAHTISVTGVPSGSVVTYATSKTGTYSKTKPTRTDVGTTVVYFKVKNANYEAFAGSAKIVITASKITPSVKLSAVSYTYDGKVKTPAVTVKDAKGNVLVKNKDYTVAYSSGRKYVGKYNVKVTLKGNYSGSSLKAFKIIPRSTTISTLIPGSKRFKVTWAKRVAQTTGYQIQYSASSKFTNAKTVKITKYTTVSKTITKLTAKKRYYVRVRTYKNVKVGGSVVCYYSAWSGAKSVVTKQ